MWSGSLARPNQEIPLSPLQIMRRAEELDDLETELADLDRLDKAAVAVLLEKYKALLYRMENDLP